MQKLSRMCISLQLSGHTAQVTQGCLASNLRWWASGNPGSASSAAQQSASAKSVSQRSRRQAALCISTRARSPLHPYSRISSSTLLHPSSQACRSPAQARGTSHESSPCLSCTFNPQVVHKAQMGMQRGADANSWACGSRRPSPVREKMRPFAVSQCGTRCAQYTTDNLPESMAKLAACRASNMICRKVSSSLHLLLAGLLLRAASKSCMAAGSSPCLHSSSERKYK